MNRYYYVGPDGNARGPILPTEFLQYGLNADSLVCQEGGTQWVAIRNIPGLVNYLRVSPQSEGRQAQDAPFSGQHPGSPYPDEQPKGGPYGAPNSGMPGGYPPPTNMVWAILTTVLCCLPFGIVAIVKASQVTNLWMAGRYEESRAASKAAGIWSIVSAACALVGSILYLLYIIGMGVAMNDAGILYDI